MSKIRATKRLQEEEVPQEHRAWVGKIISAFNDYVTQSIKILNQGGLFSDNTIGKEHTYDFTYQSDALSLPVAFLWNLALPPRAFQIVNATEDGQPVIVAACFQYTEQDKVELVSAVRLTSAPAVSLLQTGSRYRITVRVTP